MEMRVASWAVRDVGSWGLLVVALTGGGCASGPKGQAGGTDAASAGAPSGRFPTAQELRDLAAKAAPREPFGAGIAAASAWDLTGPFPDTVGVAPVADTSPFRKSLQALADGRPGLVVASDDMRCVAHESALFYLANHGDPPEALRRFLAARCGSTAATVDLATVSGDVPDEVSDEDLEHRWGDPVGKMLGGHAGTGSSLVGLSLARKDGHAVVVFARGTRKARVETFSPVPDAASGAVVVRGELLEPAATVRALVNRGKFGVSECELDPTVRLPRFAISCKPDAGDDAAWIEVSAFPAGRIVGTTVLAALVWPKGARTSHYVQPSYGGSSRTVDNPAELGGAVLELLNGVRATAGLASLTLSPQEGETATRLAIHFFSALFGLEPELVLDQVVLGLKAGWDVDARVTSGECTYAMLEHDRDLQRLLAFALERPVGREVLLDPKARKLAVGPATSADGAILATLFATYAIVDEQGHDATVAAVRARIDADRQRHGLRPSVPMRELDQPVATAERNIASGEQSPEDAHDRLLSKAVHAGYPDPHGWLLQARSADTIDIPAEMIAEPDLALAVAVAYYRPAGEPWWRTAVILTAARSESVTNPGLPR